MSFGFSVGDFVAGGELGIRLGSVLVDADKAPNEFQHAADTSHAFDGALNHLDGALTSAQPDPHTSDITSLVQNIRATGQRHQQKADKRYGKKLGKNAPRGRRHGVLQKLMWPVVGRQDEEKHQKEQQGPVNALHTHMFGLVVGRQDAQLLTAEQGLAQEEAHHNSVVQRVSQLKSEVLQRVDETHSSTQQQQAALARTLDVVLAELQGQKEIAQELRQIMTNDGLQIRMYGSDQIGATPATQTGAPTLTDSRGKQSTRSHNQGQLSCLPSTNKSRQLKAISVLKVHNRSMEFTWWNQGRTSRAVFPHVSLTGSDEGVILTFFFVLLGMCLELGLELGRYVSSQVAKHAGIPSTVSFMMSDTIEFTDALGRSFKLSVVQYTTWELIDGWLREQFKGCPGSSKVQDGKYVIFDARNPDRILTKATWRQAVRPRRRFQMAIAYEHMQLNHSCPKCEKPLPSSTLTTGYDANGYTRCPSCGVNYSFSISGSLKSLLRRLSDLFPKRHEWWDRNAPRQLLMVETSVNGMRHATTAFRKLTDNLAPIPEDDDLILDEGYPVYITAPGHDLSEPDNFPVAYSHWRAGEDDESNNEADAMEDDPVEDSIGLPTCGPKREISDQERRERMELAHFSTVWMQRDGRLHDAALSGDYASTAALIRGGVDINQTTGRTGSALIAAIARGSTKVVELLLTNGADPLQPVHQGHTPVSVAVCLTGRHVADLVLQAAFRESQKRPSRYQDVVDTALYESTRMEQHQSHRVLLFMGANPTSTVRKSKSAFALALTRQDSAILENFLIMLYDRNLLTDGETRAIYAAVKGTYVELHHAQPWLRVCCAGILEGSSQPLEREVTKRIRKRGGRYFRLNIDNLRCHPDIRNFWRKYENDRLGIVSPPELAGMS